MMMQVAKSRCSGSGSELAANALLATQTQRRSVPSVSSTLLGQAAQRNSAAELNIIDNRRLECLEFLMEQQRSQLAQLEKRVAACDAASEGFHYALDAVIECLSVAGVVSRDRISESVRERRSSAALNAVLQLPEIVEALGHSMGLSAAKHAAACSKAHGNVLRTLLPNLRRICSAQLIVIGGFDAGGKALSTVEKYDPIAEKWVVMPRMRAARYHCAVAVVRGKLYVFGGTDDKRILSTAERFDPANRTWEAIPQLPTARNGCCASAVHGKAYVFGGHGAAGGGNALGATERFDPASATWEVMPPMPTARSGCAAASVRGKLYVCGGRMGTQPFSTLESFDSDSKEWRELAPMPTARCGCAAVTTLGCVYVIGGTDSGRSVFHCMERYDPKENAWQVLQRMPTARCGCAGASAPGSGIYIFGGTDNSRQHFSTA
jgi:N-acetylneuraminic acid mutarotase